MGRGGMPGQGGPGGRGYSWQEPVERQVWTPQGTVTQTQFVRRSHPAGNMGPMGSMGDMGEAGTSGQAGGRGVDGRSGADGPGGREGPPGNRGSDGSLNVVLRQEAMPEQEASSEPEEDPVWSEHRYEAMVYIPGADQGTGVTVVAETRHRWVMLLPDGQQRSFAKGAVLVMPVDRP